MLVLRACTVDLDRREIHREGRTARLTAIEARLVAWLSERAGQVVERDELLREVWGYAPQVVSRSVDHTVARLRRKIELDPSAPDHLLSAYGAGYRFELRRERAVDPRWGNALVGRYAEIRALAEPARLWTVVGPPGIGKTRIIRQFLLETGRPATWVDARPARDATSLVRLVAMAAERSIETVGDPVDSAGKLLAALGEATLVLDNLEQVDAAADAVGRWLAGAPRLAVLASCLAPLEVPGERVLRLEPLPAADAVALFDARARVARPGLVVEPAIARSVIHRLDGLPLAVELAAARCAVISLAELIDRPGLDLSADPEARGRHASLRAALTASWELLPSSAQRALVACAAFQDPFDLAAAEAVAGGDGVLDALQVLVRRSLLHSDGSRLHLLESVRAFAAEQADDPVSLALAHARWAVASARPAARSLWFERSGPDLLDRLQGLSNELVAAARAPDPSLRAAAVLCLYPLLEARGPWALLGQLLADLHPVEPSEAVAAAWARARFAHRSGAAPDDSAAVAALALAKELGDPLWIAQCELGLGELRSGLGRYDDAEEAFLRAIAQFEAVGCRFGEATARSGHGLNLLERGRALDAEPILRHALAVHRRIDNVRGEAVALDHLARCALLRGRTAEALSLAAAAADHAPALRDRRLSAIHRAHLGSALHMAGRSAEAVDCWQAALAVFREQTDPRFEAVTLGNLGRAALGDGRLGPARDAFEEALAVARAVGDRATVAALLPPLAAALREIGDFELAARLLDEARRLQAALERKQSLEYTAWEEALLAIARGESEVAARRFAELTAAGDRRLATLAAGWVAALAGDRPGLDAARRALGADKAGSVLDALAGEPVAAGGSDVRAAVRFQQRG